MLHSFRHVAAPLALALSLAAPAFSAGVAREGLTLDGPAAAIATVPPSMAVAVDPCEGNNFANDLYLDTTMTGGPLIGIAWTPSASVIITRVEVFTGELTGSDFLAIWSDDGGAPSRPLAALGVTGAFLISPPNTWYGADLLTPVAVTAGTKYWVVWDPVGGEQTSCTDAPGDLQQTYWGSSLGDVNGGADWFGPFSFADRRWKFRMYCGAAGCPDADADGVCDDVDRCPSTALPGLSPEVELGVNRWADVDGDGTFDTVEPEGNGPKVTFTMEDTQGCSCDQIIEALGIGEGHEKFGCSTGIMRRWVDLVSP